MLPLHKVGGLMKKDKEIKIPKDFWIKKRPHVSKKEKQEDMLPFEWSNDVLSGKRKAVLYSANRINKKQTDY